MQTRYKLTLAYDGTAYAGWQIQPNGVTVQEKIEQALASLLGGGAAPKVHGSGRTDQGVHARGQVAHTDLPFIPRDAGRSTPAGREEGGGRVSPQSAPAMAAPALRRGLNALLPPDIRVLKADRAAPDFHARRSAVGKEYRYCIWNGPVMPPHRRLYAAHQTRPLDAAAMQRAADRLAGRRDFAAFSANPNRPVESTVRELRLLQVVKRGHEIVIRAAADGFLYKMVRSLAGYLVRVGEGAETPGATADILSSRLRTARVPTAPPQGLFLWKVDY